MKQYTVTADQKQSGCREIASHIAVHTGNSSEVPPNSTITLQKPTLDITASFVYAFFQVKLY